MPFPHLSVFFLAVELGGGIQEGVCCSPSTLGLGGELVGKL